MGDVGWTNTESRQWECVINQWFRLRSMEVNRLNHRVFKWAYMQGNKRYKNWCIRVKHQFSKSGSENYFWDVGVEHISKAFIKQQVKNTVFDDFKVKWRPYLERNNALRGTGGNKLRTYRLFKQSYGKEQYISCIRPELQRGAYRQNLDAVWRR